ncbi:putative Ubiquitin carboxyl terminal hydrolase [Trypanosoma vivax]|uniref:ubiquitinyl hydrolase 1 n=1 Tax=Trypanosoma vivax (strain Y486) TaxID=1055687 RepID=G0TTU2_TRYVY|nr:hypothetical protein TRVL_00056 [Trypanosoma vivax]KAH8613577.1 putative Ubiquitin carboxyl terminal hydrolase [Trypanosoma vivax]CCC47374.1 conserved hypothetical protein [Trypanosoma vivax Y486]
MSGPVVNGDNGQENTVHLPSGIVNSAGSCDLNAVVQLLYHLPSFREAVCSMGAIDQEPIVSSLRDVFTQLNSNVAEVSAKKLMGVLSSKNGGTWVQHDLHELMQHIFEELSAACERTSQVNFVKNIFCGELSYTTRALGHEEYLATHSEQFSSIELLVKGKNTIFESLDQLQEPQRIESVSLQLTPEAAPTLHTVERIQRFERMPHVLIVHPNRADFCMETMEIVTLDNKWTFPMQLDLQPYISPQTDDEKESDKRLGALYVLRSVGVHQGPAQSGHYFVLVHHQGNWCCIDDTRVFSISAECAMNVSYGGEPHRFGGGLARRACLLVYVNADVQEEELKHVEPPSTVS